MFATIYLPDFYLQAALRHSRISRQAGALIDDQKKAVIVQLNAPAAEVSEGRDHAGVRTGPFSSCGSKSECRAGENSTGNPAPLCRPCALCGS